MKRICFCAGFFLFLLLLIWGSGSYVHSYADLLTASMQTARQAAAEEELDAAAQELQACIQISREKEHVLALFIRREAFTRLDETLHAALEYAKTGNSEETLAELARAESQIYGILHLFSQLV